MAKQDMNAPEREPWPVPGYWDRRAPRTEANREAAFRRFLELSAPYVAAIETAGNVPWHGGDIHIRRNLFYRRYARPQPPAGIPIKTLAEIRRDTTKGRSL